MNRLIRYLALALLVLGLASTRTRADYIFDVTIPPSGTGTLDFTITSSDNATLSAFGLELLISPTATATALASFTTNQANPFDTNPTSLPYVFAGQSLDADLGFPFWSAPYITTTSDDTINGGDSADPTVGAGYVTLTSTGSYLATVQFQAPQAAAGQVFQITLVNNPVNTYFDDANGQPLNYAASLSGGTVNINVTAVPEPSSLVLGAIASLGGLLVYRRNRRRSA